MQEQVQKKKHFFKTTDYKKDVKSSEVKNSLESANTYEAHSKTNNVNARSENRRKPLICFNCNKPGHEAAESTSKTRTSNDSNEWKQIQAISKNSCMSFIQLSWG